MGHVQDCLVSTNMVSNEWMIYHRKVHIVSSNLGSISLLKSKIHKLNISGQMSLKPPIVVSAHLTIEHLRSHGRKYLILSQIYSTFLNCSYFLDDGLLEVNIFCTIHWISGLWYWPNKEIYKTMASKKWIWRNLYEQRMHCCLS